MQKNNFCITDDGKVICEENARVSVREIFFAYLKIKASSILFTLIIAYLGYQAIIKINENSGIFILLFVIFSTFLFWFLNKKPKQT